jgi:hypothetical protein
MLDIARIRQMRVWLYNTLYSASPDRPMDELNDKLAKLERYERRAFPRRKRAMQSLDRCRCDYNLSNAGAS